MKRVTLKDRMEFCMHVSCSLHKNTLLMDSNQNTRPREEVNCCMPKSCSLCRAFFVEQCPQDTFCSQRYDNFVLRNERFLAQTSERRHRPTPFGIRNILGLPVTDTARKDTKKQFKMSGKTKLVVFIPNVIEFNLLTTRS